MNQNTFVIVTWNNEKEISLLIDSLIKFAPSSSAIIVDNNSKDRTVETVQARMDEYPIQLLELHENLGFAEANNLASKSVQTEYITFLNPDALLVDDKLTLAFADLENPNIGQVGGMLLNLDGTIQPSVYAFQNPVTILIEQFGIGKFLPSKLKNKLSPENSKNLYKQEVDWIIGAFFVMKTQNYRLINGFSTDYFMYSEDMDLSYKLKLHGLKRLYNPEIQVSHIGGRSELQDVSQSKRFKLLRAFSIFARKYDLTTNISTLYFSYLIKSALILPLGIISPKFRMKFINYVKSVKYLWKEMRR